MKSDDLKQAALCWLRFRKQLSYIATECGYYSADVIGADSQTLVEVEVKVSMSDLRAEFRNKVRKHERYPDPVKVHPRTDMTKSWYPTHMYFLVPQEMATDTLEFLADKCKSYGVMYFRPTAGYRSENDIHVVRNARMLRPKGVHQSVLDRVASRMASEIIGLRRYSST